MREAARSGYTLIEMVVTVGIFSLAFVTIAAIFIGFTTAQSRATVSQKTLNEGNYLLEAMAREIRMNAIDYNCDGWNVATDRKMICLKSSNGLPIRFSFTAPTGQQTTGELYVCKGTASDSCLTSPGSSGEWVSLRPSFMSIPTMSFQLFPYSDPYSNTVSQDDAWQPLTTIVVSTAAGKGRAYQKYDFQTAVSSRVYGL